MIDSRIKLGLLTLSELALFKKVEIIAYFLAFQVIL